MNAREKQVKESRSIISDQRIVAFLRAVRAAESAGTCLAVTLINQELDRGGDLNTAFFTGEPNGYLLEVEKQDPNFYRISFGCQAGVEAGDGGSWQVGFNGDTVVRLELETLWVS